MSFEVGSNNSTGSDGSYIYTDALKPTIKYFGSSAYWNGAITSPYNGSSYNAFVYTNDITIYFPENELINNSDTFIMRIMCFGNISRIFFNTKGFIHRISDETQYLAPITTPYDTTNPINAFWINVTGGTEVTLIFYKYDGYGFGVVINGTIAGRN